MTFAIKGGGVSIAIVVQFIEINFGPPTAVFGSICSSKKTRKFGHIQQQKLILCFDPPITKINYDCSTHCPPVCLVPSASSAISFLVLPNVFSPPTMLAAAVHF